MGREKEAQQQAEDRWASKARAEHIVCEMCGNPLGYDERHLLSEKVCSGCKHAIEKDD